MNWKIKQTFANFLNYKHFIFRYHYYLQMKNDILEGRLTCDARVASLLASYSMQAEFGNYDANRHTLDCLQQIIFFPKVSLKTKYKRQDL